MRQLYLILMIILVGNLNAQSIRKNYQEMTDTEKVNLVNAFYQLRTGADLINDLASYHSDFFNFETTLNPNGYAIHNNLPDRPENDIFFAWHRRQMFEVEQAMQDINPNLSLPYWDSSVDQSETSSLWDQNFLGQFDSDWSLGRDIGGFGPLPTAQDVIDVQANTNYLDYSNLMERGDPHVGAHKWIGGVMRTPFSPRDPAFYLHHTNVDKLWSEWQENNQISAFQMTTLIRYDGTYVFDGVTLPSINPNDLVDTRFFGTFYAENGLAELDNYTVSNSYNNQENFYYQFTIQAGSNFIIPVGTDCKFESVNEIILKPGFEAVSGSDFIAKIDNQPLNKLPLRKRGNEIVRNQIPFDEVNEFVNVYDNYGKVVESNSVLLEPFPNPFSDKITIQLTNQINNGQVIVYDLMGRVVRKQNVHKMEMIQIENLNNLSPGIYFINVFDRNNEMILNKKIIKM